MALEYFEYEQAIESLLKMQQQRDMAVKLLAEVASWRSDVKKFLKLEWVRRILDD